MINTNILLTLNQVKNNNSTHPSFQGRKIVVREVNKYFEKLKINNKIDRVLNREFYNTNQRKLPNFLKKFFISIENILTFTEFPIIDIKKYDILGVFDDKGKVLGGLTGKKLFGQYQIYGLYLDDSIRRTKSSGKVIGLILEKVKELAQRNKAKIICCEAYKNAPTTVKLYKKVGFKECPKEPFDVRNLSVRLFVNVEDIGKNFKQKFK